MERCSGKLVFWSVLEALIIIIIIIIIITAAIIITINRAITSSRRFQEPLSIFQQYQVKLSFEIVLFLLEYQSASIYYQIV